MQLPTWARGRQVLLFICSSGTIEPEKNDLLEHENNLASTIRQEIEDN